MALKLSEEHYYALDKSLRFAAQKFVLTSVNMDTLTSRIKLHHILQDAQNNMSMSSLSESGPRIPELWVQIFVLTNISFIAIYPLKRLYR